MEYFSKDDVLNLLNRNSITKKITLADGVSIYDSVKNLPAADVVPKREVEKIFEEIENRAFGFGACFVEMTRTTFDEIKKKYTESEDNP